MVLGAIPYVCFIGANLLGVDWVIYIAATFIGFGASLLWPAQGLFGDFQGCNRGICGLLMGSIALSGGWHYWLQMEWISHSAFFADYWTALRFLRYAARPLQHPQHSALPISPHAARRHTRARAAHSATPPEPL